MSALLRSQPTTSVLRDVIVRAIRRARLLDRRLLCTHIEPIPWSPDPLAFLAASARALGNGALWWQQDDGIAFAGAGVALDIHANGRDRFSRVSAALRDLAGTLIRDDADTFPVIGGFAFDERRGPSSRWDDFPDARFVVPAILLQVRAGVAQLRVTVVIDPLESSSHAEIQMRDLLEQARLWCWFPIVTSASASPLVKELIPTRQCWESSVASAVARIRQQMLDKVVLAREARLATTQAFSPFATLRRLEVDNRKATLFAMQSGDAWFLGATPERLVRLEDGRVDVTCLAGSIGIGNSPGERQQLAQQLLASDKDRHEHEIVVRSTIAALEDVCADVTRLVGTPRVAVARSVLHLETPISGRIMNGQVLDLVQRLHPTPAVGGFPRDTALALIRELELIERGWYAGPFGWTDLSGSGEFAVAIRSALLRGRSASVFAGCGIVADSDPASEYEESRLKMTPMLAALRAA